MEKDNKIRIQNNLPLLINYIIFIYSSSKNYLQVGVDEGGHEEGERFAGAGLRDADEVLARHQVRPRLRLNRRWAFEALQIEGHA